MSQAADSSWNMGVGGQRARPHEQMTRVLITLTLRTYYALTAPADVGASESPEPEPMFFQCCVPPTAAANGYCFDKPPSAPCPEGSKLHICSDKEMTEPDGSTYYPCKLYEPPMS